MSQALAHQVGQRKTTSCKQAHEFDFGSFVGSFVVQHLGGISRGGGSHDSGRGHNFRTLPQCFHGGRAEGVPQGRGSLIAHARSHRLQVLDHSTTIYAGQYPVDREGELVPISLVRLPLAEEPIGDAGRETWARLGRSFHDDRFPVWEGDATDEG